ncbi:MAG: AGE family epimerase/isomerase [Bdellovibrio sp.]|nr:AGE family epimerase/isomerase [Bdellovibrio sp.]
MSQQSELFIKKSKDWLTQYVYPLWTKQGIDTNNGGFAESLTFAGEPMDVPRRAMVQARQIYAFLTGANLVCCPQDVAHAAVLRGNEYLINKFSQPSGAFAYSVNPDGTIKSNNPDLYTQAFALFGMAQAYSLAKSAKVKKRAVALVNYLHKERAVPGGGYTEIDESGKASYKSNPHMHMFESAIAWMSIDTDPIWQNLGKELLDLALNKFIDKETGALGEYFDANWNHIKENGVFIYEPGHQYEWAWLMFLYEKLTGQDLKKIRHQLFLQADKHGTSPTRKVAFDEMWSNHTPKLLSSRFWPQCERIKAAVRLGTEVSAEEQPLYAKAADDALETLFKFFETPLKGLWYDALSDKDEFNGNTSKASSLYHIVNAMEEYINLRGQLKDK